MVGYVEWVEFVRGDHVPAAGEIVHATDGFEEPAGGGAVAAAQLARMAGSATLITALGDDEVAGRSRRGLAELGVQVEAATREEQARPDDPGQARGEDDHHDRGPARAAW